MSSNKKRDQNNTVFLSYITAVATIGAFAVVLTDPNLVIYQKGIAALFGLILLAALIFQAFFVKP